MNLAQIVVYRSPLDQWIWESGVGWGCVYTTLGIAALCVVGVGLAAAEQWVKEQWRSWRKRK